ncbi:MAG: glycosyl transferase [Candidatus Eremiobacter antarcticus]|nr:glycosyltransferase [Candidatus Eremiobacteraeota bacterium]MBC5807628.1 glycosyltransferase [Candidatus Eremiobacteraeota bacterium]PZR61322.1 MAG: glycosyl transferase [Candidatus Eremiobacter sp. RRmetagenome_bin22]
MAERELRCSIVIATRNRVASLLRTLEELTALEESFPIIVVDNDSGDGTPKAVQSSFPQVNCIALRDNLGAAARTIGCRKAVTRYVGFSDDDSWWTRGSLTRAADILDAYPTVALLAARVLVGPQEQLDPTCALMSRSPLSGGRTLPGRRVLGFLAAAGFVRRSAFLDVRGFHRKYRIGGEEELLSIDLAAAGWDLIYVDSVTAHHYPQKSNRDERARRRLMLRNALWTAWLRRPLPTALRRTATLVKEAADDPVVSAGVVDAIKGLPWVLLQRRPVPAEVETALQMLG